MILTVTLNPALDRIMFIPAFVSGNANRIYRRENCIGGKGAHVSFNLADLGQPSTATGIAMGPSGQIFLQSLRNQGVTCDFFLPESDGDTRTNYIIVEDTGVCSQVCEKGPVITTDMLDAFLAHFTKLAGSADIIVISGDASNYVFAEGSSFQQALLQVGKRAGARVVLDANGKSLSEGVTCSPFMIKPNEQELKELTGMPTDTDAHIIAAIRSLDPYNINVVAVTLGGRGSIIRFRETYYRASVSAATLRNEVGCGDAFLAGFVYGVTQQMPPADLIRFATACGGAEAENPLTVGLDPRRVGELVETVQIEEIPNERIYCKY